MQQLKIKTSFIFKNNYISRVSHVTVLVFLLSNNNQHQFLQIIYDINFHIINITEFKTLYLLTILPVKLNQTRNFGFKNRFL